MICILFQHLNDHLCFLIARQYAIPFTLQHLAIRQPNMLFHSWIGQTHILLTACSDYCAEGRNTVLHCNVSQSNIIFVHNAHTLQSDPDATHLMITTAQRPISCHIWTHKWQFSRWSWISWFSLNFFNSTQLNFIDKRIKTTTDIVIKINTN